MNSRVTIEYFAYLRERRGLDREEVETSAGDAAALFDELAGRHGFGPRRDIVRVAVNDEIAAWNHPISSGDRVVFLTPFGGG